MLEFWTDYAAKLAKEWGLEWKFDSHISYLWTDHKMMIYIKESGPTLLVVFDDGNHGWCKFWLDPDDGTSLYASGVEGIKMACKAWSEYEKWRDENEETPE